jgi:ribose transport system ATP-binding protein
VPKVVQESPRVAFRHLTKVFDATTALDDVSFDVGAGEVRALLGANGAGKSTLIKVLAGFHKPDGGRIEIDGVARVDATADVSFIHQELGLIGSATVAENIALTRGFPRRCGLVDWKQVHTRAEAAMAAIGSGIAVGSLVSDLTRAEQSMVAIARAVDTDCSVLVLDEPTASLQDEDVQSLFRVVRRLVAGGVSILYVTHHLDEVFELADRVTVMRDGRVVADGPVGDFSHLDLVRLIVGADLRVRMRRAVCAADAPEVLALGGVQLSAATPPMDVVLHAGEIVGLAGLRGAGQELLGRGLAGVEPLSVGACRVGGEPTPVDDVAARLRGTVGFASSRRETEGLAMTLTVRENMYLNPALVGNGPLTYVAPRAERRRAADLGSTVHLRPNRPDAAVGTLSGGNQQKVVLARWLSSNRAVLVLEEPTMGIDIGARAEIYDLIQKAAADGRTVVVVSSDFEELATLCGRVLVLDRGRLVRELIGDAVTEDAVMNAASSAHSERGEIQ